MGTVIELSAERQIKFVSRRNVTVGIWRIKSKLAETWRSALHRHRIDAPAPCTQVFNPWKHNLSPR